MIQTKYRPLQLKTVPSDGSGIFTGLASTYGGDPDWQNDIVQFGAFAESILKWHSMRDMPPIFFNHRNDSAGARIGKIISMQEIADGLLITAKLNLKNDLAAEVYGAMLNASLDQLSIGYAVHAQHKRADGVNVLTKLDLIEVSVTPVPANPRAVVLSVKSLDERFPHRDVGGMKFRTVGNRVEYADGTVVVLPPLRKDAAEYALKSLDDAFRKFNYYDAALRAEVVECINTVLADGTADGNDVKAGVVALIKSKKIEAEVNQQNQKRRSNAIADRNVKNALDMAEADLHVGDRPRDPALDAQVDALITDVRKEKAIEDAGREAFEATQASLRRTGHIDWLLEDAREQERIASDLAKIEQRDAQKTLEVAAANEADRIRREDRNWGRNGVDYYVETIGVEEPLAQTPSSPLPEPRITDMTVVVEPDAFSIATQPQPLTPEERALRLDRDDVEGKTT